MIKIILKFNIEIAVFLAKVQSDIDQANRRSTTGIHSTYYRILRTEHSRVRNSKYNDDWRQRGDFLAGEECERTSYTSGLQVVNPLPWQVCRYTYNIHWPSYCGSRATLKLYIYVLHQLLLQHVKVLRHAIKIEWLRGPAPCCSTVDATNIGRAMAGCSLLFIYIVNGYR